MIEGIDLATGKDRSVFLVTFGLQGSDFSFRIIYYAEEKEYTIEAFGIDAVERGFPAKIKIPGNKLQSFGKALEEIAIKTGNEVLK